MRFLPKNRDVFSAALREPGITVLISDSLLHLGVGQGLEERTPLVGLILVPDRYLDCGQRRLTDGGTGEWLGF